jgi:glycosyltransferase involved in cell wall biosynthesis
VDSYARSIAVIFPPFNEDYGYVTLEAMLASKPVITCGDSGGPNEFVVDGITGRIVKPQATELARAMDELWSDRALSARIGRAGREHYDALRISWDTVTRALTE